MSAKSVLVYCQYLLGIGHVQRCALIVRAMCAQGLQVHVALGGAPVDNISFGPAQLHYLQAVRTADSSFSSLVHLDGREFSTEDKSARCAQLIALAERIQPDALIIETYPFGRRAMRFELKPLLQWADNQRPKPLLVGSVRDILQRRRAEREQESVELVNRYFDKIWVHGDKKVIPLEASFPPAAAMGDKLAYTGYVAPKQQIASTERAGILVSAGGGAAGQALMLTALQLFQSGYASQSHWTFTTGPHLEPAAIKALVELQHPRLTVTDFLQNLCEHMSRMQVSVSLAGYNTTMDVLQSGIASVMVPFVGEGETEQLQRTELLQEKSRLICLPPEQLGVTTLADAIDRALAQAIEHIEINLEGADNAAKLLVDWLR